jgi:hypothetical protein
MAALVSEVERFRAWALSLPSNRTGEWECDYDSWSSLYNAAFAFFRSRPFETWTDEELRAVLYAIARDNEAEQIVNSLGSEHPELLVLVAEASLGKGERDALWQLGHALGFLKRQGGTEERVLLAMARDEDEYVRRRALGALARLGSPAVEALAMAAWHRKDTDQEWARMMVLWALKQIGSPLFGGLLSEATVDQRVHLREYASRLQRGEKS